MSLSPAFGMDFFSFVSPVREYPIILGESWACSKGPPISLSWSYETMISLSLDEWELERCLQRRSVNEMRIPASVRTEWLLGSGYTQVQVQEAIRTIQVERQSRRSSFNCSRDSAKKYLKNRIGMLYDDQHFLRLAMKTMIVAIIISP